MDANGWLVAAGILLSILFVGVMVFKVLPTADQIVKREKGPVEACCFTRLCPLLCYLPLACFTIWMTLVVMFDESKGISVLQEVCPDDYECANFFALGRTNHDLGACDSADCGTEKLLARSGSQPLGFVRMGLGQDLAPVEETVSYECLDFSDTGKCKEAKVKGSGGRCECVEGIDVGEAGRLCSHFVGCDGDIEDSNATTECTNVLGDLCTAWNTTTDSAKLFSFQSCICDTDDCSEFTCETLTMEYFYPNVVYALLVTVLFLFPTLIVTYVTVKTQVRKIVKCGPLEMNVYSQEAGMQKETTADNLNAGGWTTDQKQKTKYRTFSKKDVGVFIVGPLLIFFFSWCAVVTAGRVGLSLVTLAGSLIIISELIRFCVVASTNSANLADRKDRNAPDPLRSGH